MTWITIVICRVAFYLFAFCFRLDLFACFVFFFLLGIRSKIRGEEWVLVLLI